MMEEVIEKKTKRLVLRPLVASDHEVWRDCYLNLLEPQNRWDKGPRNKSELTKSKFKKILSAQRKNRKNDFFYDFTAFEKNSGKIVGFSALMDITRVIFQNAYLGYGVFSPYWGKGYGKEMTKSTIEIAFKNLKLHRVEAGIEPSNKRSIALAKAVGMRREGLSKKRLFLYGEWLDSVIFAMTSEDMGIECSAGRLPANRR